MREQPGMSVDPGATDEPMERVWFPAVVLSAPAGVIISANQCAHSVLGQPLGSLVGRPIDEVLSDAPSGALELVASGELAGYELVRRTRDAQDPLSVWVRGVPLPGDMNVVAFVLPRPSAGADRSPPLVAAKVTGVGALRPDGVITWVSPDVENLLGRTAAHLVGRRLVEFVPPDLVTRLRRDTEVVMYDRQVVSRPIRLSLPGRPDRAVQLLLMPADHGAAVFMVIPGRPLARNSVAATVRQHPVVSRLTSREADIALALVAGDRVPAIAQNLSLSQGTVRNYLSAIFRKLGVSTQQELIELLREDG